MNNKLSWGIIGTGAIAKTFARALQSSDTGKLIAVASRTQKSADAFGDEFNIARRYGSYDDLLNDPQVQAVYISTPHPMHAEWAVKAADAGKHILCEKPITMNYPEAMAVVEAARRNDVFLMEGFMYRCHPQTAKLIELIRDRVIGDVKVIQATFSFSCGFNPESRLLKHELGGGGILDVGCYCTSMARLIAGAAQGKDFADPIEIKPVGYIGSTRVDEYTVAVLKFPGDIVAELSTGVQVNQENVVRIYGSEGSIFVQAPWFCGERTEIVVQRYDGSEPRKITVETKSNIYTIEADMVAANVANRQAPNPAMSWADSLGNMRTLDTWRLGIGLVFDFEQPTANFPTIDHKPLAARPGNSMQYGNIEGVDKPVSKLVMGAMLGGAQLLLPHASVMFDEFFESGGNCIDSAHIYGNADTIVGQWMKNRGNREQMVILGKGAHTPWCNPEGITCQLNETLERMQTDYLDIYMLHRDNPEIPVGEFIDILNEHKSAGRIRAFGASNWCIDRIQAANEYAKSKGLTGFTAISNNFSLAKMINAVWEGCIAASDSESRAWFEKTQMPLMAWSSTARGFFVKGDPSNESDPSLVYSWYSEDNFKRLERAKELAAKRGVQPVQIALAYVLNQPFPAFALIGPETISELRSSIAALDIELTADELEWLTS